MTLQIALLRGVNVGGHRKVPMGELRLFVEALGFRDVKTLLQSGNVVFRGDGPSGEALERLLEAEATSRLGLTTDFLVRTASEIDDAVARNPFPAEVERDPAHLVVMFLRSAPPPGGEAALRAAIKGRETVHVDGREAYLFYPDGIGESRLTAAVLEKHLGTRGTARNWNTVLKLAALGRGG